jgi:hypothetical protein
LETNKIMINGLNKTYTIRGIDKVMGMDITVSNVVYTCVKVSSLHGYKFHFKNKKLKDDNLSPIYTISLSIIQDNASILVRNTHYIGCENKTIPISELKNIDNFLNITSKLIHKYNLGCR